MNDSEKDLITANYEIEKASIKQERMEAQLEDLNSQLKKNKRNTTIRYLIVFFLLVGFGGTVFYLIQGEKFTNSISQLLVFNREQSDDTSTSKSINSEEREADQTEVEHMEKLKDNKEASEAKATEPKEPEITDVEEQEEEKTEVTTRLLYGNIVNAFLQGEATYVEIDFVDYYFGEKAVEMAIANGDASKEINEAGDTIYNYHKNYYIHNPVEKKEVFKMNDAAEITILKGSDFSFEKFRAAIKASSLAAIEVTDTEVFSIEGLSIKD